LVLCVSQLYSPQGEAGLPGLRGTEGAPGIGIQGEKVCIDDIVDILWALFTYRGRLGSIMVPSALAGFSRRLVNEASDACVYTYKRSG